MHTYKAVTWGLRLGWTVLKAIHPNWGQRKREERKEMEKKMSTNVSQNRVGKDKTASIACFQATNPAKSNLFLCPTIQTSSKCVTSSLAISISFDIRVSPMIGDYILGLVPLNNCVAKLFSSTFRLLQCEQMSCNTAMNIMIANY